MRDAPNKAPHDPAILPEEVNPYIGLGLGYAALLAPTAVFKHDVSGGSPSVPLGLDLHLEVRTPQPDKPVLSGFPELQVLIEFGVPCAHSCLQHVMLAVCPLVNMNEEAISRLAKMSTPDINRERRTIMETLAELKVLERNLRTLVNYNTLDETPSLLTEGDTSAQERLHASTMAIETLLKVRTLCARLSVDTPQ